MHILGKVLWVQYKLEEGEEVLNGINKYICAKCIVLNNRTRKEALVKKIQTAIESIQIENKVSRKFGTQTPSVIGATSKLKKQIGNRSVLVMSNGGKTVWWELLFGSV